MKTVLLAVSAFLPQLKNQEICLSTDNSTVVAYIMGHKVSDSVLSVSGASSFLSEEQHSPLSEPCSRQDQRVGRHSLPGLFLLALALACI